MKKEDLNFCAMTWGNENTLDKIEKQLKIDMLSNPEGILTVKRYHKDILALTTDDNKALDELFEKLEEKRETYFLVNSYENEKFILDLTDSQIRMVNWLIENEMIDSDWEFTSIEKIEAEKV